LVRGEDLGVSGVLSRNTVLYRNCLALDDMTVGQGDSWVPTERTHPFYILGAFGSAPIQATVLAWFWFVLLIPPTPLWFRVAGVGGPVILFALFDVWFWGAFRPTAVRVSDSGMEVRWKYRPALRIPREKLHLSARPPEGFGLVTFEGGLGFRLSPNQFTAAQRFFPLSEPCSDPAGRPLR
jgi:hypothetical protein